MNQPDKLKLMQEHLSRLGVGSSTYAPPAYRVLWRAGLNVTPPLFARFIPLALFQGTVFGFLWGLVMWLIRWQWQSPHMTISLAFASAAFAGVAFGLCMAAYFRHKARSLQLPLWHEYVGPVSIAVAAGPSNSFEGMQSS